MKIYFEDGPLVTSKYLPIENYIVVNAANGASENISVLDRINIEKPDAIIYTNSIFAFNNMYAWNGELRIPEVYIRAGEHMTFTRIDQLTTRELRLGHNLATMYIAGEFSK